MGFTGRGIYHIPHGHVSVRIALASGSSADSTPVIVWEANDDIDDHKWLIESVEGEKDTYTIRDLRGGSYMDLSGGSSSDGTAIIGYHWANGDNQKWIIRKEQTAGKYWKIQNKAAKTFVDLYNGGGSGTPTKGWEGSWNDTSSQGHQHWLFERISQNSSEVHAALQNSPYINQDFKSYPADTVYLLLPQQKLLDIWRSSGVGNWAWRPEIFDCDDFATVLKAEVAKWGAETYRVDNIAILCGIMFGSKLSGGHAYNWILDIDDPSKVIFFEPQTGEFSNNAWGYQAYFGLF